MTETTGEGSAPVAPRMTSDHRERRYAVVFTVAAVTIIVAAVSVFRRYETRLHAETQALLMTLAASRGTAISDRLRERANDASVIARSDEVRNLVRAGRAPGARAALIAREREQLVRIGRVYGYHNIAVLDAQLTPVITLGPDFVGAPGLNALKTARSTGKRQLIPVHRSKAGALEYGVVVPIFRADDDSAHVTGVVYVVLDLTSQLFPVLTNVQNGNPTFDMVLAQREQDSVIVIASSRVGADSAPMAIRSPLADSTLAARGLANPNPQSLEGVDYRRERVLGAAVPIAGTPWVIVAKIDVADLEDDIRAVAYTATAIVLLMLGLMTLFVRGWISARARKTAEDALREAARTVRVVETSTDGFARIEVGSGRFLEVNDAMSTLTGFSRAQLLGMSLSDVMVTTDADAARTWLASSATGTNRRTAGQWRCADGRDIDVDISTTHAPNGSSGGGQLYAFIRDITERLAITRRVERLNTLYVFLNHASEELFVARTPEEAWDTVTRIAVEGGFALSWVGMLEPQSGVVRPVSRCGGAAPYVDALHIAIDAPGPAGFGPTARAIRERQPVVVNDFLSDPQTQPWQDLARSHGLRSSAAFPIIVHDEAIGAIMFYASSVDFFDPESTTLLNEITRTLRLVLERLRSDQERAAEVERRLVTEQNFRGLFAGSPVAMYVANEATGEVTQVNRALVELVGYAPNELQTIAAIMERFYPDPMYRAGLAELFARNVRELSPERLTVRSPNFMIRCKDGTDRFVQSFVTRIGTEVATALVDLTELRSSQLMLREAQQVAKLASWSYAFAADVMTGSEELREMFGLPPASAAGVALEFSALAHPDDLATLRAAFDRAAREHLPFDVTVRTPPHATELRHVRLRAKISYDEQDRPYRAVGSVQDITAEVEAAAELQRYRAHLEELVSERTDALATALERIRRSEARLTFAMEASSEGIWEWDLRTGQYEASSACYAMLGYPADAVPLSAAQVVALMHPEDRARARALVVDTLKHTTTFSLECRFQCHDGTYRWTLSHGKVVERDDDDRATRVVGTQSDLSARKAFEAELRSAKEAADEANRAKSSFLAVMSHEIRTPMNGVLGMAEVLTQSDLPPRETDAVRTIHKSATDLLGLIDDILDFSKIEAGRLELESADTHLDDLLEGVINSLSPVATVRHVELSLFVHPAVPVVIRSDAARLRQILFNLAGNAVKFSGGRSESLGRVGIRLTVTDDAPRQLCITVTDNGIGMSEETVSRLFTRFMQAETSTTRRFGGTGLGLVICKRLVEMFRGTIEVHSTLGRGSSFVVTLPLVAAEVPRERDVPDVSGVRCVIVRDATEPGEADDLAAYLRHARADVSIHPSVDDALRAAGGLQPPVVLIERVPGDDPSGGTVSADDQIRHVRLGNGRRRVARVLAPNFVMQDRQFLRERSLLRAVAIAAGRASPETFVEARERPVLESELVVPDITTARARGTLILVAEDDEVNQKVILRQLELLGYAAEVAVDGAEALRMWRAGAYGLLLTDLHMPKMDGYTLVRTIRGEEGSGPRRPVLALTANALRGEETRALAVGMDAYLTKPVPLVALKQALDKWLPRTGTAEASSTGGNGPASPRVLDLDVLRSLVGNDADVVRSFLADYRSHATRLGEEIRSARADANLARLSALAHKLKSSSRSVGALELGDWCADVESAAKRSDGLEVARALASFERQLQQVLDAVDAACRT